MSDQSIILESLPNRKCTDRYGIGTADRYFRDVEQCFDGGFCSTKLFGKASQGEWQEALDKSSSQLVYCNEGMDILEKRGRKAKELTTGACLDFDCIVTTTRKDRDGDILESVGAKLDPQAPLLWQHIPFEILGRVLTETGRSRKRLTVRSSIIDSEAGRDAAQLVEFGALRISHGFRPTKFEPLEAKKGEEGEFDGWHVLEFDILEVSLVSVPSNVDAVITAFSGGKLHSPLIKSWAEAKFRARPVQIAAGVDIGKLVNGDPQEMVNAIKAISGDEAKAVIAETKMPVEPIAPLEPVNPVQPGGGTPNPRMVPVIANVFLKEFDVNLQHIEADKLEYDWISRFCSCEVKQLVNMGTFSERIRMGSFLTGLKHAIQGTVEIDARRLTYRGLETPIEYETIQLNSTSSDHFMVDGISFRKLGDGTCFAIKYSRSWNSIGVEIFCAKKVAKKVDTILGDANEWARENNFLKGEAFSLGGEFLPRTHEKWGDLFLDKKNEVEIRRTVDLMNSKGKQCPNRGQIYMGSPGTGKTLSGRLIRNHADATFIWVAGKDAYYYGGVGSILTAFELARELAPSIIFMEDIDAALSSSYAIDVLKTEMDGIARSTGVTTILTTNHPEVFPEALVDRPGRFHDVLKFGLPGKEIRNSMLTKWIPELGDKPRLKTVSATEGYSGAHVFELCQYAKNIQNQDEVGIDTAVEKALDKIHDQRELINEELLSGRNMARRQCGRDLETKSFGSRGLHVKSGRSLSAKNESSLKEAVADLSEALKDEDLNRGTRMLIKSATNTLDDVLKQANTVQLEEPAEDEKIFSQQVDEFSVGQITDLRSRLDRMIREKEAEEVLELLGI